MRTVRIHPSSHAGNHAKQDGAFLGSSDTGVAPSDERGLIMSVPMHKLETSGAPYIQVEAEVA
jgi:hypothetical protein